MDKVVTNEQDRRLLDYLDGKLEGTGLQQLKRELEQQPHLQARLDELRVVHRVLASDTGLQSPSASFTTKVMANLHARPVTTSLSPRNGLLLLAGVIVAAGLLAAMTATGFFDQFQGLISINAAPVQKYINVTPPSLPFNGKLFIKILIGLNLVLAFLILDRTVLRPFFQKRAGTLL